MSPTDATRESTGPSATPLRVFLSHTSDLGKPDEPGSFVGAATAVWLRRADSGPFGRVERQP